jgi:hypothetical protein
LPARCSICASAIKRESRNTRGDIGVYGNDSKNIRIAPATRAQSAAFAYLCILEIAELQITSIFRGVFLERPRIVEQFKASDEVVLEGDEGCRATDTEGLAKVDVIIHHCLIL